MSGALTLDLAAASRLSTLDPSLRSLTAALPQSPDTATWRLHDVTWTPGAGCRLAYLVPAGGDTQARGSKPSTSPRFVDVSVTGSGWSRRDYRDDDSLPGLAAATDPQLAKLRIEQTQNEKIEYCAVEPVRYRPGQRAVLRYVAQTMSGRQRTYYAKVFQPAQFAVVAPIVAGLAACRDVQDLLAPLVATWEDCDTVVMGGVGGTSVSALLGDPSLTPDQRVVVAQRLGHLLARLHAQRAVPAPQWSHTDQLDRLDQTLPAARRVDAALAARLVAVRDLLGSVPPRAGTDDLGHGSFRPGQVVMDGAGALVVLDVDGVCHSDPTRDLGSLLGHLVWQQARQPHNAIVLERASAAFLQAYEEDAGAVDREALRWWQAAGLLLIAARRFRRLETSGWERVPELVDAALSVLGRALSPAAASTTVSPARPGHPDNLTDLTRMTRAIGAALGRHAVAAKVTVEAARPLQCGSGRRAVTRYDVRGLDGPERTAIVGKAFREPRRALLLYQNLNLLWTASASGDPRLGVPSLPEPLAHLPHEAMVLYRHSPGTALSAVTDPSARLDGVRRAARWLAGLHSCRVTLPRTLEVAKEAASSRAWAAVVGMAYPDLVDPARHLAEQWPDRLPTESTRVNVPLHKDFHPGHVLVGAGLHVIDFDEARLGDRAFDVAHFSAYTQLLEGSSGPGGLACVFLEEYAAAAEWPEPSTLSAFEAYTWLKIARQWVVSSSPFRGKSAEERRSGVEDALNRGLRCLNG